MRYLLLTLMMVSNTVLATQLDLSLPPLDHNFCETNADLCNRISEQNKKTILPKFEFKDTDLRQEKTLFYTLNVLDSISTWRAVNQGYAREANPLLPKKPNIGQLILHKATTLSLMEYFKILDDRSVVISFNYGLTAVVANNLNIIIENE